MNECGWESLLTLEHERWVKEKEEIEQDPEYWKWLDELQKEFEQRQYD